MKNKINLPGFTEVFTLSLKSEATSKNKSFNNIKPKVKILPQLEIGPNPGSGAAKHAACISDCLSSGGEEGTSLGTCSYICAGVGSLDVDDVGVPPTLTCTPGCSSCHYSRNNLIGKQRCWDGDCNSRVFDCGPLRDFRLNQPGVSLF
jgi:hypothetical protein